MYARTKKPSGFGLVEGLVAMSIMAFALVAIIGAIPITLQLNKRAELGSLASVYARAKLEALLTTTYDEVTIGTIEPRTVLSTDPLNPASKLYRTSMVTLVDQNLEGTGNDVGLKKIVVTVDWQNQRGGVNALTFTSLLSQR